MSNKTINFGFILPTVMTFIIIITLVGGSLMQSAIQVNSSAVRHTQVQIAHIASKAAIDYAEEQYELNAAYAGTDEQDLFANSHYRATIEVVVLYDQSSSAKRVQGIGRVYIPEDASAARVIRDVKSSIIRNGEVIVDTSGGVDPATYNPLLWLDANEPNTLYKTSSNNSQSIGALAGTSYYDVVEERGTDASSSPGSLSANSSDLEMSWDGASRGNQKVGLRFRSINAPNSSTIQSAYIQFTTDETKQSGSLDLSVEGVASDNPSSWSGSYAVSSATKTTQNITWQPPNWNNVGSKGANERVDVTSIVQELVNRSGWTSGNAMAFAISHVIGSGVRTAESGTSAGAPELFIQWDSGGSPNATADGDTVQEWYDKSGNGYNAQFAYGTAPVLKLNQVNSLNAVRFSSNGALLSTLDSLSDNELVVFMVMAPRTTSAYDARFLSIMNSSQSNDSNTSNGLIPFMKSGNSTTIQQYYNNSVGRTISSAINDSWATYSSRMSSAYSERLLKNSVPDNYNNHFSVNYTVNQVYIGGRRASSTGTQYADMDVAEIIVYNKAFVCSELQNIENYLETKYNFTYTDKDPCP